MTVSYTHLDVYKRQLETLLDDTAEAEPAAAPEKLPAEEQAKEEGKGQGLGKDLSLIHI